MDVAHPLNIILVVSDTLRPAYLGCYGCDWVHTPSIDEFARQSVVFENAHPESLPTIPMRRSLHTGKRAFPFPEYRPLPWDNVYLPGWQPMDSDEPTVSEILSRAGYHDGFYSDVPHYFVPGMNFTRGFHQWEFLRGQAEDRYRSVHAADPGQVERYFAPEAFRRHRSRQHIANLRPDSAEEEWPTARTFRGAIRFLEENAGRVPVYLYVDTFTPHETWEAPLHYYRLYGLPEDRLPVTLTVPYGPLAENPEYRERLPGLRANYAGLVTMVDRWFGELLAAVDRLGIADSTLVIFTSDHGTNHADNPDEVIGKPPEYMYPGVMDVPLILRHPRGRRDTRCGELVYTMDLAATILAAAGAEPLGDLDARNLLPLVEDTGSSVKREYLSCRYHNHVWCRDESTWFFSDLGFSHPRLFDLETDPDCRREVAAEHPRRVELCRERILHDAGGSLAEYTPEWMTDAIGRPGFRETGQRHG